MAYIGVQPLKGQNRKLDDISSGFNGTSTTFNLTTGSSALTPATAYQLFISVGGVLQEPGVDFTVSGSQIVFTTAPTAGLTFFGVYQGDAIDSVSVSDGAITTAKLATGLTVTLGAGSATTPSLTFAGDTNNGIYSPGADQLAISTGGSGRLFVDASGNVGVGVSPSGRLHVQQGGGTSRTTANFRASSQSSNGYFFVGASSTATTSDFFVYTDSSTTQVGTEENKPLSLWANGTERLRITSAGLVGIGTSSPVARLETISTATVNGVTNCTFRSSDNASSSFYIGHGASGIANLVSDSPIGFGYNNGGTYVERMRIDSSGRVGIGATTVDQLLHVLKNQNGETGILVDNQWGTSGASSSLTLKTADVAGSSTSTFAINKYKNGSVNVVNNETNSAANIAFTVGSSERARIDSSGRLLLGTSSARGNFDNSSSGTSIPQFQVENASGIGEIASFVRNANDIYGCVVALGKTRGSGVGSNTVVNSGDTLGRITFAGADGSELVYAAEINAAVDATPGANDMPGRLVFSTTSDGASTPTERMRIDNAGNILVNATSTTLGSDTANLVVKGFGSGGYGIAVSKPQNGSVSYLIKMVYDNTTSTGQISTTSTTVSYSTTSDYRLKENVTAVTDGITRLQQLNPSRFNFKAEPGKTVDGFIAHEVQAVVPEAITGTKDEVDADGNPVYQGIDQSKLVPLLTAALQEAIGEIESLKARVAALESA